MLLGSVEVVVVVVSVVACDWSGLDGVGSGVSYVKTWTVRVWNYKVVKDRQGGECTMLGGAWKGQVRLRCL